MKDVPGDGNIVDCEKMPELKEEKDSSTKRNSIGDIVDKVAVMNIKQDTQEDVKGDKKSEEESKPSVPEKKNNKDLQIKQMNKTETSDGAEDELAEDELAKATAKLSLKNESPQEEEGLQSRGPCHGIAREMPFPLNAGIGYGMEKQHGKSVKRGMEDSDEPYKFGKPVGTGIDLVDQLLGDDDQSHFNYSDNTQCPVPSYFDSKSYRMQCLASQSNVNNVHMPTNYNINTAYPGQSHAQQTNGDSIHLYSNKQMAPVMNQNGMFVSEQNTNFGGINFMQHRPTNHQMPEMVHKQMPPHTMPSHTMQQHQFSQQQMAQQFSQQKLLQPLPQQTLHQLPQQHRPQQIQQQQQQHSQQFSQQHQYQHQQHQQQQNSLAHPQRSPQQPQGMMSPPRLNDNCLNKKVQMYPNNSQMNIMTQNMLAGIPKTDNLIKEKRLSECDGEAGSPYSNPTCSPGNVSMKSLSSPPPSNMSADSSDSGILSDTGGMSPGGIGGSSPPRDTSKHGYDEGYVTSPSMVGSPPMRVTSPGQVTSPAMMESSGVCVSPSCQDDFGDNLDQKFEDLISVIKKDEEEMLNKPMSGHVTQMTNQMTNTCPMTTGNVISSNNNNNNINNIALSMPSVAKPPASQVFTAPVTSGTPVVQTTLAGPNIMSQTAAGTVVIVPSITTNSGMGTTTTLSSTPIMVPSGPIPANTIIIIPSTQANTKPVKPQQKKLATILPKLDKDGCKRPVSGTNGINSNTMATGQMLKTNMNDKAKVGSLAGRPGMTQQAIRRENQLNMARRAVADISREQLTTQDNDGDTYLHVAVCRADAFMVQALLERLRREKLDRMINVQNKKRQTPLYLAVAANQPLMVNMFIKCGANPDVMAQTKSSDGRTEVKAAIHVASSHGDGYLRTLDELLQAKDINVNIINWESHSALHCAILAHGRHTKDGNIINSIPIIDRLIKAGVNHNSQDKTSGKTPLMYAIEKRDTNLVEQFLALFDPSKLCNIIKSETFEGNSCLKIAEGLRHEFSPESWTRMWNTLNAGINGDAPRRHVNGIRS